MNNPAQNSITPLSILIKSILFYIISTIFKFVYINIPFIRFFINFPWNLFQILELHAFASPQKPLLPFPKKCLLQIQNTCEYPICQSYRRYSPISDKALEDCSSHAIFIIVQEKRTRLSQAGDRNISYRYSYFI